MRARTPRQEAAVDAELASTMPSGREVDCSADSLRRLAKGYSEVLQACYLRMNAPSNDQQSENIRKLRP
jgi:hypothetical protein